MVSFPFKFETIIQYPLSIYESLKDYFSLSRNYPLIQKLKPSTDKDFKNRYYEMSYYIDNDPAVYSSLKFIALTVSDAYKPLGYDIQKEVRGIVFNLMAFGDVIILKDKWLQLPIYELSVVDDQKRIGSRAEDLVISDNKYYILNEMASKRTVYESDDIIHLSLFSQGHMLRDIYNRWTYGIYGRAPMLSLLKLLAWKSKLIDDDILIKDRMIPREVHKIKVDLPIQAFPGKTLDEKVQNYRVFVEQIMNDYRQNISRMEPGEHYVVNESASIDVIEPKINYSTPNDLIDQLTQYIIGVFNVPISAVLGSSQSAYAAELAVASYYTVQANAISGIVNEYLKLKYPEKSKRLDSVQVILDIWKDSIFKRVALLTKTGIITTNEAREMIGLDVIEEVVNNVSEKVNVENIDGRIVAGIEREGVVKSEPNTPLAEDTKNEKDEYRTMETNMEKNLFK
jgi:hypothetical protein